MASAILGALVIVGCGGSDPGQEGSGSAEGAARGGGGGGGGGGNRPPPLPLPPGVVPPPSAGTWSCAVGAGTLTVHGAIDTVGRNVLWTMSGSALPLNTQIDVVITEPLANPPVPPVALVGNTAATGSVSNAIIFRTGAKAIGFFTPSTTVCNLVGPT